MKDWKSTHWTDGETIVYIKDLIDFIGECVIEIPIDELPNNLTPTKQDRVVAANLDYPIIVLKDEGSYRYILDGNHRVKQAINRNKRSVKARVLCLDDAKTPETFKKIFG